MQVGFRLWGYAAVAGILVTALGACKPSQPPAPPAPPPSEVNVVVVEPHEVAVNYEYIGQIAGVREVEVRPRVSGILERWNYQEGAEVKAGQSLFTIDPGPFAPRSRKPRPISPLRRRACARQRAQRRTFEPAVGAESNQPERF